MPHSADDPTLVPKPPPPRPARRDAAIEAAMRSFDGEAPAPPPATARPSWIGRPQLAWAMTACLVAVIGLPTAFIVMRDGNSPVFQASPPPPAESPLERTAQNSVVVEAPPAEPTLAPAKPPAPAILPAQRQDNAPSVAGQPVDEASTAVSSLPSYAASPPPAPAPPPPPPAPMLAEKSTGAVARSDIVTTGSRIQQPNLDRKEMAASRAPTADESSAPDWVLQDRAYATFLTQLQAAIRAGNRDGVIKLVAFPLQVGRSHRYRDAKSVRADYDRIFTPNVRQAILNQKLDQLFGRDLGVMVGHGQVWFDHICTNNACSPAGPVRITAINP